MNEVLIFPLRNERGFMVDCPENYERMIQTIIDAQVELAFDYPDNPILVVFEL